MNFKKRNIFILLSMLFCSHTINASTLTLTLQDVDIRVAMQMLSQHEKINILVAEGVDGRVSVNIYNMETIEAIHAISESAGFIAEERNGNIYIIDRNDTGKYRDSNLTEIRIFKVQYTSISEIEPILKEHLSSFGSIKALAESNLLVIEDKPSFLNKIEMLLSKIDREPKQILIEAKILEIVLTDNQSYGFNWAKLFSGSDSSGRLGTQGLASPGTPGLLAQYTNSNVDIVLSALEAKGRLRTLSTPTLLAMEGQESETIVGTRLGFKVTTTVNQVTSESIEFLETGIILKVTPSVDRNGQILLDIHPEVSTGVVSDDGIPSKSTTQVSTRMLVPNGKTVFMGGLIRRSSNNSREAVPVLGDIPVIGGLFANNSQNFSTTEIIVLLTPTIVEFDTTNIHQKATLKVEDLNRLLKGNAKNKEDDKPAIEHYEYDALFGY